MKQIYKRQPRQYNLPNNYDDLDAVNYHNLNGFKGLQVYDNPLVADANSTYDCKNVYVDEHGNLTIRPALTPNVEDTGVLWKHVFSDGKELTITEGLILNTWVTTKTLQSLSVVPFETNDKKYIFLQDETRDTLYDITDGNFTVVEGVVLLDDPAKTDISHYNILNDKILYEYAGRNFGANRPSTDYDITYKVPFIIDWNKPYKIQPLSENTLVIVGHHKIILAYNKQFITLTVDTGYQRNSNDWCIEFIDDIIDITVACLNENPINSGDIPSSTSVGAYFKPGKVKRFRIALSGEIISEYTATIAGAGLFAGYGYAIALSMTGGSTDAYGNLSYELYTKELVEDFEISSGSQLANDWTEIELPVNLYPVIRYAPTDYRTKVGYYGCIVAFSGGLAYIQRSYTSSAPLHNVYYRTYHGILLDNAIYTSNPKSAEGVDLKFYSIFNDIVLSERSHLYFHEQGYTDTSFDKVVEILITESGATGVAELELKPKYPASILSYFAIYSASDNSIFEYEYFSDTPVEYSFDESVIFATDTMVITADATLIYRTPKLLSTVLPRDQSIIPVLSNINEPVVTGFFLDNCWWFITEHSIFGTGVDGNGIQTPERFDPLKYFKVSEKITGAIRISDTSFWVFHNNGAYLIYKTSLALAEGTEYRWLYTATAKSKGCDFENALYTLSVSSNIVTVTASDICNAVLRENVQSDERTLVPMTTQFAVLMRELLAKTESVKIFDYRYLTVFCLNPAIPNGTVPAVVYDNVSASWWYWEFPVNKVVSVRELEDYTVLYCEVDGKYIALKLTDDEYYYHLGALEYEVYADRLNAESQDFTQIEWYWQSAVQVFNTIERRKQLLFTTFVFDDYAPSEYAEQEIEIGYFFDIYSRDYITSTPDETTVPVYRITNRACRTTIGSFNYLQLNLQNRDFESTNFEVLTKPKICCISMKYRILRGEL